MNNKILLTAIGILVVIISSFIGVMVESKTDFWKTIKARSRDSVRVEWDTAYHLVHIKSPLDGASQKAYFYRSKSNAPQPLIVSLHSWSFDYQQYDTLAILSKEKNFNYIHPDFRGENWTANACCSELALSDMDASIDYALTHANVDTSKIYVIGRSGGGYATLSMFMKSKHKIKKFSAWVPLVDLVAWYHETKIRKLYYADNILVCTNSNRGELNREVAAQRSPIYWPTPTKKLNYSTLEIFTGVYDGLEGNGPIPITHSINFYNKLLTDLKVSDSSKYISDKEKLKLLEFRRPLYDAGQIGGRDICLRKEYGNIQLTIFTGGHEMLSEYAFGNLLE